MKNKNPKRIYTEGLTLPIAHQKSTRKRIITRVELDRTLKGTVVLAHSFGNFLESAQGGSDECKAMSNESLSK